MTNGFGRDPGGPPGDTRRALENLVKAATVRIHGPAAGYEPGGAGGGFLGSGFFIAPSWVLTCAHVAMQGEGREVDVVFFGGRETGETVVAGTVVAALPETPGDGTPGRPSGWPTPDLALVRLGRPVDHPCVYVSERPAAFFGGGQVLHAGWTEIDGELTLLSGQSTVQGTVGGWSDSGEQMRLGGDMLPYGVSGGPVVDPVRGEVVGVIKSRLVGGLGGSSIGVEGLRSLPVPLGMVKSESDDEYHAVFHAHDRYHADQHTNPVVGGESWADVQSGLGAGGGRVLSPQQRIDLLGRLAELPPPVSTHGLLDLLVRLPGIHAVDRYPAPRGWRDGLGALYESRGGDAALELVLRYCMSVIVAERPYVTLGTPAAEEALWEWVRRMADERFPRPFRHELIRQWVSSRHRTDRAQRRATPAYGPQLRDTERPFVLLELEPRGWERDSYDWRVGVARYTGEVQPVAEDSGGTPFQQLTSRLNAPLAEAFRCCDEPDRPAVLQVAVVQALLGLEVDAWRASPDAPPLGAVRPVTVRCSDLPAPLSDEEAQERRARWKRASAGSVRAEIVDCEDGLRVPVPMGEDLRSLAYETLPVLCRYADRPDAETTAGLGRVVDAGFRVALLRRRRGRQEVVCADFHRRADDAVAEAGTADQLPWKLLELRVGVWAGRTEMYWSDGVALLYDDPHHPLPGSGQLLEAP